MTHSAPNSSAPDIRTYPWFQPKPLVEAVHVRLTFDDDWVPALSIGRVAFSESCRVRVYAQYARTLGAQDDWLRPPLQAPYYIRAGMMHRLRFDIVYDTPAPGSPAGMHLPQSAVFAMWAPRSKNREPDRMITVPVTVHRS